eukprot:1238091-Rhodomonas_salina.1
MHPSEGLWLFRGAPRANGGNAFGGMFGDIKVCGAFPTHMFETESKQHAAMVCGSGAQRRRTWAGTATTASSS